MQLAAPRLAVEIRQVVVASGNTEDLLADVAGAEPARVLAIAGHGAAEGAVLALAAAKSGSAGPHAAGMLLTDVKAGKPALGPHACRVLRVAPGLCEHMYAILLSYMGNMECPLFVHHAAVLPGLFLPAAPSSADCSVLAANVFLLTDVKAGKHALLLHICKVPPSLRSVMIGIPLLAKLTINWRCASM